jgi:hypothetical protein
MELDSAAHEESQQASSSSNSMSGSDDSRAAGDASQMEIESPGQFPCSTLSRFCTVPPASPHSLLVSSSLLLSSGSRRQALVGGSCRQLGIGQAAAARHDERAGALGNAASVQVERQQPTVRRRAVRTLLRRCRQHEPVRSHTRCVPPVKLAERPAGSDSSELHLCLLSADAADVLGSGDYILNPAAAACPACGSVVQLANFCRFAHSLQRVFTLSSLLLTLVVGTRCLAPFCAPSSTASSVFGSTCSATSPTPAAASTGARLTPPPARPQPRHCCSARRSSSRATASAPRQRQRWWFPHRSPAPTTSRQPTPWWRCRQLCRLHRPRRPRRQHRKQQAQQGQQQQQQVLQQQHPERRLSRRPVRASRWTRT